MDHFVIGFLIVILLIIVIINYQEPKEKIKYLDCETTFDSIHVTRPQNRGSFDILDSLVFSSSYSPFDLTVCDTIPIRGLIWSPRKIECTISDLEIPFVVYKPTATDTLHVIKDGKTLYFKIPCDMNLREDDE